MILAQATQAVQLPDPSHYTSIGWLFVGAVGFVVALNAGIALYDRLRSKSPQPPNGELLMSVRQLTERIENVEKAQEAARLENIEIRNEMKRDKVEILQAGEVHASKLHTRIDPAVQNIAEVKGQMIAFTQSFDNFTKIVIELARGGKV